MGISNWDKMLPEPDLLGKYFHEQFKVLPEHQRKRAEWKKGKGGKPAKSKEKRKTKLENCSDVAPLSGPPEVELPTNASSFAVFANVRLAVLERWMKQACQIYLSSSSSTPIADVNSEPDTDSEECTDKGRENMPLRVPKIVGVGLRSVFELVRESRASHPGLCTKALCALLDVLQGQQPEGLKHEPAEVLDALFDLLLNLATSHGPESAAADDGSHLTAVACACLLSLVVVRGDTGKLLSATAALLMCPRALASQNIHMPAVLAALQRSVHGVLLGKSARPDWLTHGVPSCACIDSFRLQLAPARLGAAGTASGGTGAWGLASDGQYLYLHTSRGLYKLGSGYGGTIKGHIYLHRPDFYPEELGWLGCAHGLLYLRVARPQGAQLLAVDRSSLQPVQALPLEGREWAGCVLFSDGEGLGMVAPAKDDGFVVRTVQTAGGSVSAGGELPLKLARKCVDVLGSAPFDEEPGAHTLNTGCDEEVVSVTAGKDFALLRTATGKVLYCGKAGSLGVKQAGVRGSGSGSGSSSAAGPCRWAELPLSKAPKITQVAVGHEGMHAVLLAEDGSVMFCGTARRGEDGDQNKARRQPKPVKPKKMLKVEGQQVAHAACNNGTTALVTREGELLMFGKDTAHCELGSGLVAELKDVQVTHVALGKAHAVALASNGQVFTFGINNKGQCGRDFAAQVKEVPTVVAMETACEEEPEEEELEWEEAQEAMCPPGKHKWKHDLCMVCTVCRECTGYSISCLSSMRPDRNPGQECGCGEGDSGCAECGCCRICARESVDNSELAILGPSGAGDLAGMMRLDYIFGEAGAGRPGCRLQDQLQRRLDERRQRQRGRPGPKHCSGLRAKVGRPGPSGPPPPPRDRVVAAAGRPALLPPAAVSVVLEEQAGSSDAEREASRVTSLPPARVPLPLHLEGAAVAQVACGLHHSLLLLAGGEVLAFGSNAHGQLGQGDLLPRAGPTPVRLAPLALQVAAGGNHTAVLTVRGEVYTFGSFQKGQLGRGPPPLGTEAGPPGPASGASTSSGCGGRKEARCGSSSSSSRDGPWYAIPGSVPNVGPCYGRRATWVGASGDQTFLKVDESLVSAHTLARSTVMANRSSIVVVPGVGGDSGPSPVRCLAISRRDGSCSSFGGAEQADLARSAACLDPLYNVLWSYQPTSQEVLCYNVVASEVRGGGAGPPSVLSAELALPAAAAGCVPRAQAALHLLGCLDTLTQAREQRPGTREERPPRPTGATKVYSREDFSAVTRFESHGGGWGYSGHSIEAIRFMADTDVLLGGLGLFGGRGEYTGKIKLFDVGPDGGEQETDGEVLAETEEVPYECGPRQKYPMLLEEPVPLQANRWYVAWARVSGPSSDCGSSGQGMVTTEDQVVFYFKSSKKSNNGTDVNAGQIPQLLYRVVTPENQAPARPADQAEPVYILSRDFSRCVSKECFSSLLALLQWSWNTFKAGLLDLPQLSSWSASHLAALLDLERLVYVSRASLRLLRTYTCELYPSQVGCRRVPAESLRLAESIGDVRALLRQLLADPLPSAHSRKSGKIRTHKGSAPYLKMTNSILEECHQTFVACFHAFYPTAHLKWSCLCDLLAAMDKEGGGGLDRLLSAVLAALASPAVRLRSTFPVLSCAPDAEHAPLSPSDNAGPPMMPGVDAHHYPMLAEQMSYRTQMESEGHSPPGWTFREVLDRLLDLAALPVQQALLHQRQTHSPDLVRNCCHLLARVIAELASQSSGTEENVQGACGRVLHTTPSRFTRTNQSRTWNTGNGSPDAVCFSVDRPGVVVAGVCVYGGAGTYEYELELLDDSSAGGDPAAAGHAQRWTSLELARGTFGPDDCVADVAEVRLERPVPLREGVKYAVRLRNHGGRTSNGDGGLSSVKGPDGTTFSFSTCSLSFNGTTQTRGQIPQILYYSNPQDVDGQQSSRAWAELQAGRCTLAAAAAVVQRCVQLAALARERAPADPQRAADALGGSCLVTTLLPLMLAHMAPLATLDPRSGVQVLGLVHELLPHVAALNLASAGMQHSTGSLDSAGAAPTHTTTSHHYAWVESEHPYKPATVANYRVAFPEAVKWLCIEFDPRCGTAQAEDSLQLYIPSLATPAGPLQPATTPGGSVREDTGLEATDAGPAPYWPMLHKFSRGPASWPQTAIVLPGNEVIFSLETATDYMRDEKGCFYGFRCLVVGYEWQSGDGLRHLEAELAFLGGMCAASLMKKDLLLPPTSVEELEEEPELVEELAQQALTAHPQLLGRGLALAAAPSIAQALDGALPFSCLSNERLFLRDLVACTAGSSGGRLARWLQPEPRVEPARSEVLYSREDMRCGWPAIVTVLTKDQYGDVVHAPGLRVDVKAVPLADAEVGEAGRELRRVSQPDALTFGGHALPSLDAAYEVTVKDKMCYYAISAMKAYENYSFEELRFTAPAVRRRSETMLVRPNGDGSYSATWTPAGVGWYSVLVCIDGYDMEEAYRVEVREPPQGVAPPAQTAARAAPHQPSRLRKFVAQHSAGLRIRAHPSLQSEQIGIVHVNGTIAFVDEIHNDDGVWLRLSQDTVQQYCSSGHGEAWCLQYNQHLGKTLLLPVEEPKTILEQVIQETILRKLPAEQPAAATAVGRPAGGPGQYLVVRCGASGHNVRPRPSLKSPPVGILVLGNQLAAVQHVATPEGTWLQLDEAAARKFCFSSVGEAWSLALDRSGVQYLCRADASAPSESPPPPTAAPAPPPPPPRRPFAFSAGPFGSGAASDAAAPPGPFSFGAGAAAAAPAAAAGSNPFVFGSGGEAEWQEAPGSAPASASPSPPVPPAPAPVLAPVPAPPTAQAPESGSETETAASPGPRRPSPGRLGALQKWLAAGAEPRRPPPARCGPGAGELPPELAGVSVKDLVKAIGESRANGNGVTPPGTPRGRASRSSSPRLSPRLSRSASPVLPPAAGVAAAAGGDAAVGAGPLQRRGSTQSDTSAVASSLTRDLSQSPSGATSGASSAAARDLSPSGSSLASPNSAATQDPPATAVATAAPSPSLSPSPSPSRAVSQAGTQTSPEGTPAPGVRPHFSIGSGPGSVSSAGGSSPKGARKERSSAATKGLRAGGKRPAPSPAGPAPAPGPAPSPAAGSAPKQPVKEAQSPSVAEALRAIFAAFLWHEGIVHDAMACASFLKFQPGLPKQGALVVTRQPSAPGDRRRADLSKEQKARQRHSVEVSSAGAYLHIQPSTLEALTRSAATASASRSRKKQPAGAPPPPPPPPPLPPGPGAKPEQGAGQGEGAGGAGGGFHTVSVLPPALRALVCLWEQLSASCLQAIERQAVLPSPSLPARAPPGSRRSADRQSGSAASPSGAAAAGAARADGRRATRKKKEWKPAGEAGGAAAAAAAVAVSAGLLRAAAAAERETACELCGLSFPHPVTYHMRQAHPGCGAHAGGKGYNSGGSFCVGWAGNCGDGGVGGSSWYLVCDACRDKYLRSRRPGSGTPSSAGRPERASGGGSSSNRRATSSGRRRPPAALPTAPPAAAPGPRLLLASPASSASPLDAHVLMKNNALFLLELSSAAGPGPGPRPRPAAAGLSGPGPAMAPLAEQGSPAEPVPVGPFSPPPGLFQCLAALGVVAVSASGSGSGAGHSPGPAREEPAIPPSAGEGPLSDGDTDGDDSARGRGGGTGGFHRSISMGPNGAAWARREPAPLAGRRRRNNSSGEAAADGGSSLLCYPSAALQRLVPAPEQAAVARPGAGSAAPGAGSEAAAELMRRPALAFVLQQHNLPALALAMRQALRKATCRVYAMQALNWLLRSVTQPTSLHDLLWWFVAALMPAPAPSPAPVDPADPEPADDAEAPATRTERRDELELYSVCEHPLCDISIAGEAVHPLPAVFHGLLQTVADLMLLLPMGSALQQMAVRCWGLRFSPADHMFLHRSHVFSNISKILSRSEEEGDELTASLHESHQSTYSQASSFVESLRDLTSSLDIRASSRQAMVVSLIDSSTETFWESGDEDRNKTKTITLVCALQCHPRMVYIHIDNCRDLANKVSSVTFQAGPSPDELYRLRQVEVESRASGWISCPVLDPRHAALRLELKGPDNSLRLRQVRVLGEMQGESLKVGRQHSALTIQQRNCEAETLRVFRLITSQVFGKLILGQQSPEREPEEASKGDQGEESNDLKEHMVGILFSRSKLTHLQRQVCVHIVQAIRKEASRVRDEWEALLSSAPPEGAAAAGATTPSTSALAGGLSNGALEGCKQADTYCFEMLSMVLALSGSAVGRAYLAHQHGLLRDLLSLLHTGSARVQRQVTALLRRMLPEVPPAVLAAVLGVTHLPPADFSIVATAGKLAGGEPAFDVLRPGILDVFLSVIAKALTVQVKVKGRDSAGSKGLTAVSLAASLLAGGNGGSRWWLRGSAPRRLAEVLIQLLKDMAGGKLSDGWAAVTKGAVAENILNLTRLEEGMRAPADCLRTPTLWLALASLCVLDSDHVERLSSGQWSGAGDGQPPPPRPTCSNHDDGETAAIIQCNVCGNLCADCDRFLHLHRRTRMHQRQVCKEEEEAIRVDLHEGCGRTKLFWVLALADSRTLKALVEFREGARTRPAGVAAGVCRFCGTSGSSGLLAIGNVCADHECQEHARNACSKVHMCGHVCGGIRSEAECLPCLHGCARLPSLKQDADDMCMICFTEALACAPALQLCCGHVFHLHCCRSVLVRRWAGPRITFSFAQCPICKAPLEHPALSELLAPVRELLADVRRKALMRLEYEGLHRAEAITAPGARFHNDPASYAMDRYAYYVCYKCNKAYYGGEARCDAELGEQYDPAELVCGACSDVARAQMCPKHGTDFLEYKCRYCCSVAVFFCFGTTHFCNACHDDFQRVTNIPRLELPSCPAGPKAKQLEGDECPLHVKHPPTGEEFALGCGVCRNAHTF